MEKEPVKFEETVQIIDPSPEVVEKADSYIVVLRGILPDAEISLIGSLAIPVSIKNEIDILVEVGEREDIKAVQDKISMESGKVFRAGPIVRGEGFMRSGKKSGLICELHILHKGDSKANKYRELIKRFQSDPDLLKEYDVLKKSLDGASSEKYKAEKAKFFRGHNL